MNHPRTDTPDTHDADPLQVAAIELLSLALAHCTPRQVAAVIAAADLDAMTAVLRDLHGHAQRQGLAAGWRLGYLASEADTAAAWRPLAERVRRGADRPTWLEIEADLNRPAA